MSSTGIDTTNVERFFDVDCGAIVFLVAVLALGVVLVPALSPFVAVNNDFLAPLFDDVLAFALGTVNLYR